MCRAEDERRQQVAPAARSDDERREAAGAFDEVIADRRQLVAQVRGVGQICPVPLRIGVDAAESMSMNSDGARVPVNFGLSDQSPCGRSYTATRENEFHLLKRIAIADVSLRVDDVERGGARELGCTAAARSDERASPRTGARSSAPARKRDRRGQSTRPAAVITTPGAPSQFSSGIEDEAAGGRANQIGRVEDVDAIGACARTRSTSRCRR